MLIRAPIEDLHLVAKDQRALYVLLLSRKLQMDSRISISGLFLSSHYGIGVLFDCLAVTALLLILLASCHCLAVTITVPV